MRTVMSFLVLLFIQLNALSQEHFLPAPLPVDQIKISGNIHLELIASDSMLIQFESDTVPENLGIKWAKNSLTLKTATELKKSPAIKVKVCYTSLSGLEITRGARVQSIDTLKTSFLSLRVDTGGKAEFNIQIDSLSARVNQGSDIILGGSTYSQSINANTVGNFLAYELEAKKTWVKASTGAQVKINSSEYLKANASGKAFVGYLGSPEKTEFKNSMGGKITREEQ